jgi:homoserine dehydrogenase
MSTLPIAEPVGATVPSVRTVRVALAGCGVVGAHLLSLLREHGAGVARSHGVRFDVVRVLVRDAARDRAVPLPPHIVTADVTSFLDTPADVVVEALGGLDPSTRIAAHGLAAGRHFITANKALVATHGPALRSLARRAEVRFCFEAAVAGGVPVLRVLRDALVGDDVHAVRGVLNGTTNFILTRMERGASFTAALDEARRLGFAEADPTRDLSGMDAADKIAILAWLAFGTEPATLAVARLGLLPDADALVRAAAATGASVRLIAEAVRLPGGVAAAVEPVIVDATSAFARAAAEENIVEIATGWTGTLRFSGPGAGGAPTASALLGDLLAHGSAPHPLAGAALRGIADPRRHTWLLTCDRGTHPRRAVIEAVRAAGAPVPDVLADGSGGMLLLTAPLTRAAVDTACDTLRCGGIPTLRLRHAVGRPLGDAAPYRPALEPTAGARPPWAPGRQTERHGTGSSAGSGSATRREDPLQEQSHGSGAL